jgi:hypothetical protein
MTIKFSNKLDSINVLSELYSIILINLKYIHVIDLIDSERTVA